MFNSNVKLVCEKERWSPLVNSEQDMQRIEELIGDLIRHVAKTHGKTTDNEFELIQIKLMLSQIEEQNKYLYEHNEKLTERITALEKA
jgi:hypothetical protein